MGTACKASELTGYTATSKIIVQIRLLYHTLDKVVATAGCGTIKIFEV
jgi:hypothetical protein